MSKFICILTASSLAFWGGGLFAGDFIFSNNSRNDVAIVWVTEAEHINEGEGDMPSTFYTIYSVHGWRRIVPGGETRIRTKASSIYALIRLRNPTSGKVSYKRFHKKSNGSKRYRGFLVNVNQAFDGTQRYSPTMESGSINKLKGRPPSGAKGEITQVSKGATGKWGEFGLGDPNLRYVWGFGQFRTANGNPMRYYIE